MSNRKELLKLAELMEDAFCSVDIEDEAVLNSFASAMVSIKEAANKNTHDIHEQILALADLASALDMTQDPELMAEASEIDSILFSIAYPKTVLATVNSVYDSELESLIQKRRAQDLENKYTGTRETLDEIQNKKAIQKAIEEQVKVRRPLQDPLSTRYSPDRPGVSLMRITDNVYQDPSTGKIYDYQAGYTTDKGNKIPGTSVHEQTHGVSQRQPRSMFTTREGLLNSADKS